MILIDFATRRGRVEARFVLRLGRKAIADSGLGQQKIGTPRVAFASAPQAKDGRPQGPPSARRVGAPESREDAIKGRHAARRARQDRQDAQLGRSERERLASHGDIAIEEVDDK